MRIVRIHDLSGEAWVGMGFQDRKKQDVFSEAYRDIFTAVLKTLPSTTYCAVGSWLLIVSAYHASIVLLQAHINFESNGIFAWINNGNLCVDALSWRHKLSGR